MGNRERKIIAVDFDGTIVKQEDFSYDRVDFQLLPNAKEVLDWLYENFYVVLWTCRDGIVLNNAIQFLSSQSIQFHAINQNMPTIRFETSSKIFADFYFDNRSFYNECEDVNWLKLKDFLTQKYLCDEVVIEKIVDVVIEEPQIATFDMLKGDSE